jgi:hypothetical protein
MHWLTCNPTRRALEQQRQLLLAGGGQARPVVQPVPAIRREPARPLPTVDGRDRHQAVLPPAPGAGR